MNLSDDDFIWGGNDSDGKCHGTTPKAVEPERAAPRRAAAAAAMCPISDVIIVVDSEVELHQDRFMHIQSLIYLYNICLCVCMHVTNEELENWTGFFWHFSSDITFFLFSPQKSDSSVQFNSYLFFSPIGARTLKMPVPYST